MLQEVSVNLHNFSPSTHFKFPFFEIQAIFHPKNLKFEYFCNYHFTHLFFWMIKMVVAFFFFFFHLRTGRSWLHPYATSLVWERMKVGHASVFVRNSLYKIIYNKRVTISSGFCWRNSVIFVTNGQCYVSIMLRLFEKKVCEINFCYKCQPAFHFF